MSRGRRRSYLGSDKFARAFNELTQEILRVSDIDALLSGALDILLAPLSVEDAIFAEHAPTAQPSWTLRASPGRGGEVFAALIDELTPQLTRLRELYGTLQASVPPVVLPLRLSSPVFPARTVRGMAALVPGAVPCTGVIAVFSADKRAFREEEARFLHESACLVALALRALGARTASPVEAFPKERRRELEMLRHELAATKARLDDEVSHHLRDRETLAETERKCNTLFETTLTGIYVAKGGRIINCNERFARIFGYIREELAEGAISIDDLLPRPVEGGPPGATAGEDADLIVASQTKGGERIWLKKSTADVYEGGEALVLGNVIDVTDQVRVRDELRLLSTRLLNAQEQERKRVAFDLHDGIGQSLSAIKFGIEHILEDLCLEGILPEKEIERLERLINKVQAAMDEVRNISAHLRPPMLDDLGLVATINWFIREFERVYPRIRVSKEIELEEKDIPDGAKLPVFRIIQEASNNVARHAGASEMRLSLARTQEGIQLRVEDNGRGFVPGLEQTRQKGVGLNSMRERAVLSGARFAVSSAVGQGTSIDVLWPESDSGVFSG